MRYLTRHLHDVDETYTQHLCHAMRFAVAMFFGALACLVHAFLPFLFETTGSRCITRLYDRMVSNRRNLTPVHQKPSRLQTANQ